MTILNLVENGKTAILNLVENGKMYKNTAVIIAFISCEFLLNLVFLTLETINVAKHIINTMKKKNLLVRNMVV